jgi:hypothetical protein
VSNNNGKWKGRLIGAAITVAIMLAGGAFGWSWKTNRELGVLQAQQNILIKNVDTILNDVKILTSYDVGVRGKVNALEKIQDQLRQDLKDHEAREKH